SADLRLTTAYRRRVGAVAGSIMPIIMISHMVNSSRVCFQSHSGAIIHEAGPSMVPYMSRAIDTIHAQHSNTMIARAPVVSQRSCFKAVSSAVSPDTATTIEDEQPRASSNGC